MTTETVPPAQALAPPVLAPAPTPAPVEPREVIYVLGYGRSGSTVLDVLLGRAPGVESVGELDLLHRDWTERTCSCGEPYDECPFWSAVDHQVREQMGGRRRVWIESILRRVESLPSLVPLALGWLPPLWTESYRGLVRAQLRAIAHVSGSSSIVDSSKSAREAAGRALALEKIVRVSVKRIHLVRDGRAVLWSLKRGDNVRLAAGRPVASAQLRFATMRAVFGWTLGNAVAWLQTRWATPGSSIRVHYEDLVARPDEELVRLERFLGRDLGELRRMVRRGEPVPVGHNTGGNRVQRAGSVRLDADREWETELGRMDRVLFWIFAWPVAWLLRRRGPEAHHA